MDLRRQQKVHLHFIDHRYVLDDSYLIIIGIVITVCSIKTFILCLTLTVLNKLVFS